MSVHSAVGRKAGITKDEYISLIKLDKKDFLYREWIALMYAREWAYAGGREAACEYSEEFRRHYSLKEQSLIKKLLHTMLFANYCGNIYYKRPWKKGIKAPVCEVNFETPAKNVNDAV